MDADVMKSAITDIPNIHNGIAAVSLSSHDLPLESVPNEKNPEWWSALRTVAMSGNIAKSVQNEVRHLIRVDSSCWDLEDMIEKNTVNYMNQMVTNINMARSSCSHILPEKNENVVLAIVLSKWDDIMGPLTLHVWLRDRDTDSVMEDTGDAPHVCHHEKDIFLMKAIKYVTCHTVNYMADSPDTRSTVAATPFYERNTSFFVVPDLEVVVQSIRFNIRDQELSMPCSLALVVNYKHYKYFLNLKHICQFWLRRLAHQMHQLLVVASVQLDTEFVTSSEMNYWIVEFNQMLISLNTCGLGLPRLAQPKCDKLVLDYPFIEQALTSHLQTLGCSVVMGTSIINVNAMIEFLSLFLAPSELFCSRIVDQTQKYSFHMGLFVQGLLLDEFGCRQLSSEDLSANPYPVTAIDLTRSTSSSAVKQSSLRLPVAASSSMVFTSDNRRSSKLVCGLLADLKQLSTEDWRQMVELFVCKVKALSATLLNLSKRTGNIGGFDMKGPELQKQFCSIMNLEEADFLIIQAAAEKLQPGSFVDFCNSEPKPR